MNTVNQKIIDAVIEKAEKLCPESLALVGVYGSVATGEAYAKSDLDLLLLIQNDDGWQLGTGFILDDSGVGYDIYCTSWNSLRADAGCYHAQLSKLLDSNIVYVKNQEACEELCRLREQTKQFLASGERFQRVNGLVEKAKVAYADACLQETLGQVRLAVFGVVYYLADALMLFHGKYFKRGTKRMPEELAALPVDGTVVLSLKKIAASKDVAELRELAKTLLLYTEKHVRREEEKKAPSADLRGTYEEMYSNWRNKVEEAAGNNDVFASFANLCNLQCMFEGIAAEVDIETYNLMEEYDPDCLDNNVRLFDACLRKYEDVYKTAGISVRRFPDVDAFAADYLE